MDLYIYGGHIHQAHPICFCVWHIYLSKCMMHKNLMFKCKSNRKSYIFTYVFGKAYLLHMSCFFVWIDKDNLTIHPQIRKLYLYTY